MLNAVIKLAATVAFAISLTGCGEPTASVGKTVVSGTADIGGAYNLVNQDGEAVSESSAPWEAPTHLFWVYLLS